MAFSKSPVYLSNVVLNQNNIQNFDILGFEKEQPVKISLNGILQRCSNDLLSISSYYSYFSLVKKTNDLENKINTIENTISLYYNIINTTYNLYNIKNITNQLCTIENQIEILDNYNKSLYDIDTVLSINIDKLNNFTVDTNISISEISDISFNLNNINTNIDLLNSEYFNFFESINISCNNLYTKIISISSTLQQAIVKLSNETSIDYNNKLDQLIYNAYEINDFIDLISIVEYFNNIINKRQYEINLGNFTQEIDKYKYVYIGVVINGNEIPDNDLMEFNNNIDFKCQYNQDLNKIYYTLTEKEPNFILKHNDILSLYKMEFKFVRIKK